MFSLLHAIAAMEVYRAAYALGHHGSLVGADSGSMLGDEDLGYEEEALVPILKPDADSPGSRVVADVRLGGGSVVCDYAFRSTIFPLKIVKPIWR